MELSIELKTIVILMELPTLLHFKCVTPILRMMPCSMCPGAGSSRRLLPTRRVAPWCIPTHPGYKGLPSGYVRIAIENGHRNSGFSH